MRKPIGISTPQFRTALIRALKNIAPEYDVETLTSQRGFGFRLIDKTRRYRSEVVRIYRNRGHALDHSNLERLLRAGGFPKISYEQSRRNSKS